ncbi:MAG: GDYXXLXY domain-containing protein [Bacillota bacterium]
MRYKRTVLGLFVLLALIQTAVPVWMIVHRETTLKTGRLFKFRTAPVDPYDAFRGRYVAITIENSAAPADGASVPKPGQKVYVHITEDSEGFAAFDKATVRRPEGDSYIQTRVNFIINEPSGSKVYFEVPFDRYYMEETAAPAAEDAYRQYSSLPGRSDAYVTVRVKDGFAVLEELYVGGKPIREFVRERGQGRS